MCLLDKRIFLFCNFHSIHHCIAKYIYFMQVKKFNNVDFIALAVIFSICTPICVVLFLYTLTGDYSYTIFPGERSLLVWLIMMSSMSSIYFLSKILYRVIKK